MSDYSSMDRRALLAVAIRYGDVTFRSILEARWALFFDCIGVKWQYEPMSFAMLDRYTYTPDFYLPDVSIRQGGVNGVFVEIKPNYADIENRADFYMAFPTNLFAFAGDPPGHGANGDFGGIECGQNASWGWDNYMVFMRCMRCKHVKIEYGAEGSYRECPLCGGNVVTSDNWDREPEFPFDAAREAAQNARIIQADPVPFLRPRFTDTFFW